MSLVNKEIYLDLLTFKDHLNVSQKNGKVFVRDPIRKKNIILQPEEMVRQLIIQYFIQTTNFHRNHIQVEKMIYINDLARRFDIVIYDKDIKPYILVECKAPDVRIDQSTFDQIAVYNMRLNAPYLLVSNGQSTYCAIMHHETKSYKFLSKLPEGF
ncbi:MAG: type I restriction enzyme HsdR N-terminal domain-containing protein [Saprospiraceae bacterium]|nr:type I restriction enzyme HsdR N-terminal domain-containing protein [Saprospiraceae bacterium]